MKKILLILAFISGLNCFSQTLDSVHYTYDNVNQELSGYIEGYFFWGTTNKDIVNITDSIIADTVVVEVHYVPCQIWNLHTFYDTTFVLNLYIPSGQKFVKTISIMDVNLDTNSCYFNPTETYVDTAFFELNIPIGIEEYLVSVTSVFPNPVYNNFSIETPLRIESLKIYDNSRKYISSLKITDKFHDISNLNSGVYILEIETREGVLRKKIVKK